VDAFGVAVDLLAAGGAAIGRPGGVCVAPFAFDDLSADGSKPLRTAAPLAAAAETAVHSNQKGNRMFMPLVSKSCAVGVLTLAAFVYATPSRAQEKPSVPNVAGTTWAGVDSDNYYYEYNFRANHEMDYKSPTGFFTNGTWRQMGDIIYMETNHKFSERQGRISGTHMSGNAWNVKGEKWTWQADEK